jgi:heme/copper-type cytochrome/quinol oxidase subunit 2
MSEKCLPRILAVLALAASWAWAAPSFACPVCFGDTDSPMAGAANLSILFMMIVTYVVILGGLATVFVLRMKARKKQQERKDRFVERLERKEMFS